MEVSDLTPVHVLAAAKVNDVLMRTGGHTGHNGTASEAELFPGVLGDGVAIDCIQIDSIASVGNCEMVRLFM